MKDTGTIMTRGAALLAAGLLVTSTLADDASAQRPQEQVVPNAPALEWDPNDPRIGLGAGWLDAESAISGLEHLAAIPTRASGPSCGSPSRRLWSCPGRLWW